MWVLHYDEGVVTEELPAWHTFGPHGAEVANVVEQVAGLTVDQVRALPVPTGLPQRHIPVELLPDPVGSPLRDMARSASSTAMVWTETAGRRCFFSRGRPPLLPGLLLRLQPR